jgi:hypothetical protein
LTKNSEDSPAIIKINEVLKHYESDWIRLSPIVTKIEKLMEQIGITEEGDLSIPEFD